MRSVQVILAAVLALSLAGCVLRGKQQKVASATPPPAPKPVVLPAPPPPPGRLSIPQTDVQLPPPQPIDPEAVAQIPNLEETHAPAPAPSRPSRRPAASGPRPEPAAAVPAQPPAQPEADRLPIQEIVPAAELDRFKAETADYKREIQTLLQQAQRRRLNHTQQALISRINAFVKDSDAAADRNDWRGAHELANRAVALARELTGGK
jgi:hypothetical protein